MYEGITARDSRSVPSVRVLPDHLPHVPLQNLHATSVLPPGLPPPVPPLPQPARIPGFVASLQARMSVMVRRSPVLMPAALS
jgi:hypothetical protein